MKEYFEIVFKMFSDYLKMSEYFRFIAFSFSIVLESLSFMTKSIPMVVHWATLKAIMCFRNDDFTIKVYSLFNAINQLLNVVAEWRPNSSLQKSDNISCRRSIFRH